MNPNQILSGGVENEVLATDDQTSLGGICGLLVCLMQRPLVRLVEYSVDVETIQLCIGLRRATEIKMITMESSDDEEA